MATQANGRRDRAWLLAALGVLTAFMIGELVAGLLANSLALVADAGHMLTDVGALLLAVIASRIAERPARGAFTYGFARADVLSGQANGITLVLLAVWFVVEGVRRLIHPESVQGVVVIVVASIGIVVNAVATWLASRANRRGLNVRGVLAHLVTDVWSFGSTLAAGIVITVTGWLRADAVASLVVAGLMFWTGGGLVRAANRVFLEAAPIGVNPAEVGAEMAAVEGVASVHDLHVWELGGQNSALSAHVLVHPTLDCHEVADRLRRRLAVGHGIEHVTLQVDHADDRTAHRADGCVEAHGEVHLSPAENVQTRRPPAGNARATRLPD
jgi:cobalt-zinc-cadmium efflux system protein